MPADLFRPLTKATQKVTHGVDTVYGASKIGIFQARTYDPSRIRKVGYWINGAGFDYYGQIAARALINPWLAEMQRSSTVPISSWTSRYTAAGGAGEPYIWNPFDAAKPEYNMSAMFWPGYENQRIIYKNWVELFQAHLPLAIEWLAPNFLKTNGIADASTVPLPNVHIHSPHGKISEDYAWGMDFYNSEFAYEHGFDYLVEGFYEQCRFFHSIGVTVSLQIGHPSQNNSYTLRNLRDYHNVIYRFFQGRVKVALDGVVIESINGIDGATASEIYANGDGVGMEALPNPGSSTELAWLATPYDFNVFANFMFPRVHPDYALPEHAAWPKMGTQQFSDLYGANRYIFWQLYATDFGLTWPDFTASFATIDAYLAAYATACRRVITLWPKSVLLLPWEVIGLAASRRYAVSNFTP